MLLFLKWETLSIFSLIMLIVTGGDRKTTKQVECMEKAGVVEKPNIYFLEEVEHIKG